MQNNFIFRLMNNYPPDYRGELDSEREEERLEEDDSDQFDPER